MKQITMIIQADGQTTATAQGFEGSKSRAATAFLRQTLGPFLREQLTFAYYQSATTAPLQQENRT
jgi:hypothetical protein